MSSQNSFIIEGDFYRVILDAVPSAMFVVEEDVRIIDYNFAASKILAKDRKSVVRKRAGELLHCIHSTEVPEGCGRSPHCTDCIIRDSVNQALAGNNLIRKKERMELITGDTIIEAHFLITAQPFKYHQTQLALLILEDISELIELRSILPVCANCKKVRDDEDFWDNVESYLKKQLDIELSHSVCPDCSKKLFYYA